MIRTYIRLPETVQMIQWDGTDDAKGYIREYMSNTIELTTDNVGMYVLRDSAGCVSMITEYEKNKYSDAFTGKLNNESGTESD